MTGNMAGFAEWKDRMAWAAVTAVVVGGAGWAGWMTTQIVSHVDEDKAIDLIKVYAPYAGDRQMIMASLQRVDKNEARLAEVIERNTEVFRKIDVNIVKLSSQLENQQRILQRLEGAAR